MEQKIAPLNLGFMTLAMKYFQFILAFVKKKIDASETGKI